MKPRRRLASITLKRYCKPALDVLNRRDKNGECVGVFVVLWEKLVGDCPFQLGL
jgi:hypothetical protein